MDSALKKIVQTVGCQAALASICGVKQQTVSHWARNKVPAERVLQLERLSNGAVTRYELRPDLYPPEEYAEEGRECKEFYGKRVDNKEKCLME